MGLCLWSPSSYKASRTQSWGPPWRLYLVTNFRRPPFINTLGLTFHPPDAQTWPRCGPACHCFWMQNCLTAKGRGRGRGRRTPWGCHRPCFRGGDLCVPRLLGQQSEPRLEEAAPHRGGPPQGTAASARGSSGAAQWAWPSLWAPAGLRLGLKDPGSQQRTALAREQNGCVPELALQVAPGLLCLRVKRGPG